MPHPWIMFSNRRIVILTIASFGFAFYTNITNVVNVTLKGAILNSNDASFKLQLDDTPDGVAQKIQKEEIHGEENSTIRMRDTSTSKTNSAANKADTTEIADLPNPTTDTTRPSEELHPQQETKSTSAAEIPGSISNFQRYEGVVIVTKVLRSTDAARVSQMLCFLQHGYNDRMQYDIVVFTTIPWEEEEIVKLQKVVAPAKLTVAVEGPPLEEQIAAMTPEEKQFLYQRCNVTDGNEISWYNYCTEKDSRNISNLGYAWQAEFRAYHIWTHEAIKDYKYMMWFDADALVGKTWDQDPMQLMVEKDLVILFAAFPYGMLRSPVVKEKMEKVYNKSICAIYHTPERTLYPRFCDEKSAMKMPQIGGFHHITNLEAYRKPIHQQFLKSFVGDYRFSRLYDDQIAVTIPAIMEQDMRAPGVPSVVEESGSYANLTLRIAHHGEYHDGKRERARIRTDGMYRSLITSWPGLEERCGKYF